MMKIIVSYILLLTFSFNALAIGYYPSFNSALNEFHQVNGKELAINKLSDDTCSSERLTYDPTSNDEDCLKRLSSEDLQLLDEITLLSTKQMIKLSEGKIDESMALGQTSREKIKSLPKEKQQLAELLIAQKEISDAETLIKESKFEFLDAYTSTDPQKKIKMKEKLKAQAKLLNQVYGLEGAESYTADDLENNFARGLPSYLYFKKLEKLKTPGVSFKANGKLKLSSEFLNNQLIKKEENEFSDYTNFALESLYPEEIKKLLVPSDETGIETSVVTIAGQSIINRNSDSRQADLNKRRAGKSEAEKKIILDEWLKETKKYNKDGHDSRFLKVIADEDQYKKILVGRMKNYSKAAEEYIRTSNAFGSVTGKAQDIFTGKQSQEVIAAKKNLVKVSQELSEVTDSETRNLIRLQNQELDKGFYEKNEQGLKNFNRTAALIVVGAAVTGGVSLAATAGVGALVVGSTALAKAASIGLLVTPAIMGGIKTIVDVNKGEKLICSTLKNTPKVLEETSKSVMMLGAGRAILSGSRMGQAALLKKYRHSSSFLKALKATRAVTRSNVVEKSLIGLGLASRLILPVKAATNGTMSAIDSRKDQKLSEKTKNIMPSQGFVETERSSEEAIEATESMLSLTRHSMSLSSGVISQVNNQGVAKGITKFIMDDTKVATQVSAVAGKTIYDAASGDISVTKAIENSPVGAAVKTLVTDSGPNVNENKIHVDENLDGEDENVQVEKKDRVISKP